MAKTVYLHFGRGKTGTTYLQAYLARNRARLRQFGIDYIPADGRDGEAGHQQFAKSFIDALPRYMEEPRAPLAARQAVQAAVLASASEHILISSENFPLCKFEALRTFFTRLDNVAAVHVIFFVRSQDELAESEYNQIVKLKGETCCFETYATSRIEGCDYFEEATRLEAVFGAKHIQFGVFDAAARNIVPQFLDMLGIDYTEFETPNTQAANDQFGNISLGYYALQAVRALNAIAMIDRRAIDQAISSALKGRDVPALMFDSDWGRRFRETYAASNEAFSRRFLGRTMTDLGGRRYSDDERDAIRQQIAGLNAQFKRG